MYTFGSSVNSLTIIIIIVLHVSNEIHNTVADDAELSALTQISHPWLDAVSSTVCSQSFLVPHAGFTGIVLQMCVLELKSTSVIYRGNKLGQRQSPRVSKVKPRPKSPS